MPLYAAVDHMSEKNIMKYIKIILFLHHFDTEFHEQYNTRATQIFASMKFF